MHAPRSPPQSDNFFKFNRKRNPAEPENFLKSRLTAFSFNNITASTTRDMGISLRFLPQRCASPWVRDFTLTQRPSKEPSNMAAMVKEDIYRISIGSKKFYKFSPKFPTRGNAWRGLSARAAGALECGSEAAAFPGSHFSGLGVNRRRQRPRAFIGRSPCATTRVQISFCWTPMSARPSAVGGRLAVPSVYIAAEPGSVGAPFVGALKSAMPTGRAGTRPAPTSRSCCARCRGTACCPLVPHLPCGTPGRASPASRHCIHPFERRRRLPDPEVATANWSWELAVGSSSKEKPAGTRAVVVATARNV